MELSKDAGRLFRQGRFAEAAAAYRSIMASYPELADFFRPSLARALERAGASAVAAAGPAVTGNLDQGGGRKTTLSDLMDSVNASVELQRARQSSARPSVTVVMTTHDVEDYVTQAVVSVLRQRYPVQELVIVDDASTDGTWDILRRLAVFDTRIVLRRLNLNLGTYFAKNFGLSLATGELIFFQDGDDISHTSRIEICVEPFSRPEVVAVHSSYSRVRYPGETVVRVNGMVKKLGLITMGFRRSIVSQIGFFNSTTKASDEEYFRRVLKFATERGAHIESIDLPLYYNTLREGSLFSDMVVSHDPTDDSIVQELSPARSEYVKTFSELHSSMRTEDLRNIFRFPVIRDCLSVEPSMSRLSNPKLAVIGNICTIPERREGLEAVLSSISAQVDALHVFLDRYESVPEFVANCHPRVTWSFGAGSESPRDNAKFMRLNNEQEDCYYFCFDDDIIYPPDYVNALVSKIDKYEHRVIVGVHGVRLPEKPEGYFSGFREVLLFSRFLEKDTLVNLLGTGTVAFHSGCLRRFDYRSLEHAGMVDIHLAIYCKKNFIPMVAIARHEEWLREVPCSSPSLYDEFNSSDRRQSELVMGNAPWGYASIREVLDGLRMSGTTGQNASAMLSNMLPEMMAYLR